MANIGDTLPQTKTGWKRYDDSYINILYSKRYDRVSLGTCYRGSCSYVLNVPPDETNINFTFIGTKIRLFCVKFNDRSDIVDIDIDGIVEQFNTKENIDNTSKVVYEKLDLDNKVHKVKISVNKESQSVHFLFDCVDIDEDGYILSPIVGRLTQRTSVEDMEIGDIISCKYTATTAGKIGEFSELGVCNCEEIPRDVSSPTPNGKFFFIKVDDNKLIADRNIQNNISWNEINSNIDSLFESKSICLLDGGVAYNNDITESFPKRALKENETDEYILYASGSLGGSVVIYKAFNKSNIDANDSWHSGGEANPYLKIFSKKEKIISNGFIFTNRNSDQFPQAPSSCILYGSNDNENFEKIYESSSFPQNARAVSYHYFNSQVEYLYYQFNFSGSTGYVAIGELEFLKEYDYKNSSLSLVNKNQGGWPTINGWDTYVWKGNLNGRIDAGDNNIWNYKSIVSFTKNIAILSIQSVYGVIPAGNRIVVRGYNDQYVNDNSPKRLDISITTHKSSTFGFRPMLVIGGDK
ncbi:discoidin domain-containing protein [Clostridioides difficile]